LYFQNKRIYPSYIIYAAPTAEDKLYSTPNLRWDSSWGLILGDMLCSISQTFLSYNSLVEKHVAYRESFKTMINILKDATTDFRNFYDSDIIHKLELRSAFETAKETFLTNSYEHRLIERVRLFSDYEIEENESKLNFLIFGGGLAAYSILAATLDVSLLGLV